MPEGLTPEPKIVRNYQERGWIASDKVRAVALQQGYEFLGKGSESLVFVHPDDPNKVVAFVHEKSSQLTNLERLNAAVIYHNHRIWQELFPNHFPKIMAVVGGENARTTRERIESGEVKLKHPFEEVLIECRENGLEFPRVDRGDPKNFMIDKNGNEYYVDLVSRSPVTNWGREKLLRYMDKINVDDKTRELVLKSEQRLREVILTRRYLFELEHTGGKVNNHYLSDQMIEEGFDIDSIEGQRALRRMERTAKLIVGR